MKSSPAEIELSILAELSRNVLEWQSTGRLPDNAELRRYAANLRNAGSFEEGELLRKAEDDAARAAMRFVIKFVEEIDGQLQVTPASEGYEGSAAHLAYELRTSITLMAKTATVRPDVWQRCVTAALRAATLLEKTSPSAVDLGSPVESSPSKSDQDIVNEVNDLAGLLLRQEGYSAPEGHLFYVSDNPRARKAFERAVEAYELITGTEVHDALLEVLPEGEGV